MIFWYYNHWTLTPVCLDWSSGYTLPFLTSVAALLGALDHFHAHAQYAFNPNSHYPHLFVGELPQASRTSFTPMHRRAGNACSYLNQS